MDKGFDPLIKAGIIGKKPLSKMPANK